MLAIKLDAKHKDLTGQITGPFTKSSRMIFLFVFAVLIPINSLKSSKTSSITIDDIFLDRFTWCFLRLPCGRGLDWSCARTYPATIISEPKKNALSTLVAGPT
jgi:hypothetical protein